MLALGDVDDGFNHAGEACEIRWEHGALMVSLRGDVEMLDACICMAFCQHLRSFVPLV